MFACNHCNYKTDKRNNYMRHLQSQRHYEKLNLKMIEPEKIKEKTYSCGICSYKTNNKNNYSRHVSFCAVQKINKSIEMNMREDTKKYKKYYQDNIRELNSQLKEIELQKVFLLEIVENLIYKKYVNTNILNDKEIITDKKKLLHLLKNKNNLLYVNQKPVKKNIDFVINNKEEQLEGKNISKLEIQDIKQNHEMSEDEEEDESDEYEEDSDTETESDEEELIIKNMKGLKKIIDCSRTYYYDINNDVYNGDLKIIGKRVHDDDNCPRLHKDNNYCDKCWWYVEYNRN